MNIGLSDFVLMPMLCLFFGLLVYFLGMRKELEGGNAPWKWAGILILLIGSFSVWTYFSRFVGIGDPVESNLFKSQFDGKKNTLAILVGFTFPIFGAIAAVIVNKVLLKRKNEEM